MVYHGIHFDAKTEDYTHEHISGYTFWILHEYNRQAFYRIQYVIVVM